MSIFYQIIISILFVSSISLIGGIFFLGKKRMSGGHSAYFVSFAAGVMLATAFLDLLPESLKQGVTNSIFISLLLGVVTFFFMERFVIWFHHHDDMHSSNPTSILILMGDSFHNMLDGVAITAAFLTNPAVGVATTLAVAAHEIPQEIADFSILIAGGMKKSKALFFNFLSALTALAGAIGSYYFLNTLQKMLPLFLAFSTGMFIYIACSDLIPDLHKDFRKQRAWKQSLPLIAGIFLAYIFLIVLE